MATEAGFFELGGELVFPNARKLTAWLKRDFAWDEIDDLGGIYFDLAEQEGMVADAFGSEVRLLRDGNTVRIAAQLEAGDPYGKRSRGAAAACVLVADHGARGAVFFLGVDEDESFVVQLNADSYELLDTNNDAAHADAGFGRALAALASRPAPGAKKTKGKPPIRSVAPAASGAVRLPSTESIVPPLPSWASFNGFDTPAERYDARRALLSSIDSAVREALALDRLLDAERLPGGSSGVVLDFAKGTGLNGATLLKTTAKHSDKAIAKALAGNGLWALDHVEPSLHVNVNADFMLKGPDFKRLLKDDHLGRVRSLGIAGTKIKSALPDFRSAQQLAALEHLNARSAQLDLASLLTAPLHALRALTVDYNGFGGDDALRLLERSDWHLASFEWSLNTLDRDAVEALPKTARWPELQSIDINYKASGDSWEDTWNELLSTLPVTVQRLGVSHGDISRLEHLTALHTLHLAMGPHSSSGFPALPELRHLDLRLWDLVYWQQPAFDALVEWLSSLELVSLTLVPNGSSRQQLSRLVEAAGSAIQRLYLQVDTKGWDALSASDVLPNGSRLISLALDMSLDTQLIQELSTREELTGLRALSLADLGSNLEPGAGAALANSPALDHLQQLDVMVRGFPDAADLLGSDAIRRLRCLRFRHRSDSQFAGALLRAPLAELDELAVGDMRVPIEKARELWNAPQFENLFITSGFNTNGDGSERRSSRSKSASAWIDELKSHPRRRSGLPAF